MSISPLPADSLNSSLPLAPDPPLSAEVDEPNGGWQGEPAADTAHASGPEYYPGLANARRVFTVGFCGTGSNAGDAAVTARYGNGELVSTLLKHTRGVEYVDKLTVDGPGSGNHLVGKAFTTFTEHAKVIGTLTGAGMAQNAEHARNVLHGKAERVFGDEGATESRLGAFITWCQDTWHALTGWGHASADIAAARANVKSLENLIAGSREGEITQINIVAWSRGVATAQIFANMLDADPVLSKIEVRLVAIDPVAGPANHGANVMTIPGNVKEAIYFTVADERSFAFETFKPTRAAGKATRSAFQEMSGSHSMLVGGFKKGRFDAELGQAVGDGMRMRVADLLRGWGTVIHETVPGEQTTVPIGNAARLADIDAQIDTARADGRFAALHARSYVGPLTHLTGKVYVTPTGYARPTTDFARGKMRVNDPRRASIQLTTDELSERWSNSLAHRVRNWSTTTLETLTPRASTAHGWAMMV